VNTSSAPGTGVLFQSVIVDSRCSTPREDQAKFPGVIRTAASRHGISTGIVMTVLHTVPAHDLSGSDPAHGLHKYRRNRLA
ncbi:MAG TPA: hypothetical protein VK607_05460, partial [Kofleriaceae bacterium]|nr:hypothetical protein [Kofleriaceae bacterium]